jgi:DMSO/TMAO reductase YedYZ molybdopterin-dependent catalytic subunit
MRPTDPSRRVLLAQLGGTGVALAAAWPARTLTGWCSPLFDPEDELIPFTDLPPAPSQSWADPLYAVSHDGEPALEASRWRLAVGGCVASSRRFTLADLARLPRATRTTVFECSANGSTSAHRMVGQATWSGVSLRALLEELQPAAAARSIVFRGAGSRRQGGGSAGIAASGAYTRSLALEEAMRSEALLADTLNGRPLPRRHGFPLRLVVPGCYGVVNVKWLTRIELSPARTHRAGRGESPTAPWPVERQAGGHAVCAEPWVLRQRVKSLIVRVTRGRDGRITVRGIAWSDGTPLAEVEVRLDDGAWEPAVLERPVDRFAWTSFTLRADLGPGEHRLVSRARDRAGRSQPTHLDSGRTTWEDSVQFTRRIRLPSRLMTAQTR